MARLIRCLLHWPLLALPLIPALVHAADLGESSTSDNEKTRQVADQSQRRTAFERHAEANPLAITVYRRNYLLPMTYNFNPDEGNFRYISGEPVDNREVQFQLSFKIKLLDDVWNDNGDLFFGYTQRSWWQAYNSDASAPFRETNYEPEVFASFDNSLSLLGWTNTINRLGAVHQSNGRSDPLSRSWNRLYAESIFQNGNWWLSVRPWWRIPESDSDDDNPDIENYLGYGDIMLGYARNNQELTWSIKGNPGKGHYGNQIDYSFPLHDKLRGFVQYYNGYGESLIDYDHYTRRLGVGLSFNAFSAGLPSAPDHAPLPVAAANGSDAPDPSETVRIRRTLESNIENNPLAISAYRRNYILPVTYNTRPNTRFFDQIGDGSNVDNAEIKFQLSLKVKVWDDLFGSNGDIYFAYTQRSWWQAYNDDASAPFRETNYEPEIFASFDNSLTLLGWTNTLNRIGFAHESNGRSDPLSRSWNRIYADTTFQRGNWWLTVTPHWRIPEGDRQDNNPDLENYIGYTDMMLGYARHGQEITWTAKGNTGKGNYGNQIDYSFPLHNKLRGFIQLYEGYGESLIDYDHYSRRIGLGFSFNAFQAGMPGYIED
ncbi:phospholipase A [Larsenimonas rhizosphaerae]|uniref:Phospholipase A1 n=1 Tax=Larsenimonas rhizosphaerae TaxID=2944682 RepID=A0AA42CUP9_9GAMM|nr:phospholipase A [Larsenimonas rhizosphaerae]MCM2132011.1 phospholipase A [Larsenimonas rhizosphaerae]MCX2524614.1 phospholipase A [Larsenimonas rhizosphaerae]